MRCLSLFVLAGTAAATESNAMRKIIDLLGKMKATVEAETAQGQKDRDEHSDWCIKTITDLEADVKYGSQRVEEQTAIGENGAAESNAQAGVAAECAAAVGKSQKEQKTADKIRQEEGKIFAGKQAELVEADGMLNKAYGVLKNSLASFLQGGEGSVSPDVINEVVGALGQIVEAVSVETHSPEQAEKIASFVQEASEQPQATVRNYESRSGGILDAIKEMQVKNAGVLKSVRDAENRSRHAFNLLTQDLKTTEENQDRQRAAAVEESSKQAAIGKDGEAKASEASDVLTDDKTELLLTKASCQKAEKDWAATRADAGTEVATIQKALDILTGKFGAPKKEEAAAFLQVASIGEDAATFERRQDAVAVIRKLGHQYKNLGLVQLAVAASEDPFIKIRGMIADMITKLESIQANEAETEGQCRADKKKGKEDVAKATANFEKTTSRESAAKAKIVSLGQEIQELGEQLQALAGEMASATKTRSDENRDNTAVIQEAAESIEAITGAISTLNEYYGGGEPAALLQTGKKSDTASVITQMLQTAQQDFEKLKQDTEFSEAKNLETYETFMQESKVTTAKKEAMKEAKTNERSSVKAHLAEVAEDLEDATKELDSTTEYLKGVTKRCAHKEMSYEERVTAREAELAGLREALEILGGQASAFLQKRN